MAETLAASIPRAASAPLEKLLRSGLFVRERYGRHRYLRIAGPEVAEALGVLTCLGAERMALRPPPSRNLQSIRRARLCYDHFTGELVAPSPNAIRAASGPCSNAERGTADCLTPAKSCATRIRQTSRPEITRSLANRDLYVGHIDLAA